jgi:hypothetical protein
MSVATNQEAIQGQCSYPDYNPDTVTDLFHISVYTCGGQNGSIPVKKSQGSGFYEKNSCMVVEMEGVIDGESGAKFFMAMRHAAFKS